MIKWNLFLSLSFFPLEGAQEEEEEEEEEGRQQRENLFVVRGEAGGFNTKGSRGRGRRRSPFSSVLLSAR